MKTKHRGWIYILLLIIPYILIIAIFQLIGYGLAGYEFGDSADKENVFREVYGSYLTLAATLLTLWLFMRYVDRLPFVELGFQIKDRLKEFFVGVLGGGVIMIIGFLILIAFNEINFTNFFYDGIQLLLSVLLFVSVAVLEEVLLRGYILRNLMISFNKYVALVISSLLFASMHLANPNMDLFSFIDLFLAGILLGISYIYTKNLWFPIGLHLGWNFFQSLLGFNVSGQDFYSLVEFKIAEANTFNGGAFGFEGSILSIIAEILFIFTIWYYYFKKQPTNTLEKTAQ
ncbi:lysostaphin resistance A-like protein [Leeuwenhoekiella sp. A16]|uniref:CPBP family intramembrane glutamic endopeptidase n=1 Tax=unclassified Leeuwenhoekiella TaxID=2615029 RepID=UPI003A80DAFF|tara:strand:+ start:17926 stop:18786 length:861 start_codon:yes stop_codon:yes gene_type:complete